MGSYIDVDKAIAAIRAVPEGNWSGERYVQEIMKVPAADVRENVRGEWIHDEITRNGNTVYTPNAKCSVCDCYVFQESNYCPNCGADMRGEQDE